MKQMLWTKDISVGVPEIDAEHKFFMGLINKAIVLVEKKATKEEVDAVILELYDYAKKHFDTEEREFEKWNYPYAKEHSIEHIHLLEKVKLMYDSILFQGTSPNVLLEFLVSWLENHLKKYDLKYEKYIREHHLSK